MGKIFCRANENTPVLCSRKYDYDRNNVEFTYAHCAYGNICTEFKIPFQIVLEKKNKYQAP